MALKLMYITNNIDVARIAEECDVDWIFVDLELNGKMDRQGHLDTVISCHHIDDVRKIKRVLEKSELLVRVNPMFSGSADEINRVIEDGADIVMLPFFRTSEEVEKFIEMVDQNAKTILLLETPEAVANLTEILKVEGIDYIHIGLNDLHLGYDMRFMFELLANGTVEMLCKKIGDTGIEYGFGGIAQIGKGHLPAEYVIAEHYRLGSTMAILSRSFCNVNSINNIEKVREVFCRGVSEIRKYENGLSSKCNSFFHNNRMTVKERVMDIVGWES